MNRLRVGFVLIATALTLGGCRERERLPLNVVLITLDATRADHLGCYGSGRGATPAIDRIAAQGVRFDQADSVVPLTLPSHATILTGVLPQRHGLRTDGSGSLRLSFETLATVFSRRGFRTGAFVGSYLLDHRFGLGRGFGVYDDAVPRDPQALRSPLMSERPAAAVTDAALAFMRGAGTRPFFAWIHLFDPHEPYAPPEPFRSRFPSSPYDGEIAYADSQVARVIDYLNRAGLRNRTIIVVAGDHGEGLGEHGEATHGLLLYESTLRVPLIIAGPGIRQAVFKEAVSTADIAPTIAALAGAPMNVVRLDGRDLSRGVTGHREPPPRDIYAETMYPMKFGWTDLVSVRREGKKLISGARDELFDLHGDPAETKNLIDADRALDRELAAALVPSKKRSPSLPAIPDVTRADPRSMTPVFHDYEEATNALDRGDLRSAITMAATLVARDPTNPEFRAILARAYTGLMQNERSLRLYREAAALAPADPDPWYALAAALQAAGDPLETKAAVDEALRLDPNRAEGHNMRGLVLVQGGDLAGAVEEFRRAIAIDPRDPHAYNNLGNLFRDNGHLPEALEMYRRAIALAPQFSDARLNRAAALEKAGKTE
ncbi:MAG TPA: sulfatase-like hydrolase/transferase [Thermoanaerobaculia bacterium]|nr:sulfatase-like hydrolase/transferase [Thermoanaerobaculia bacterium]